MSGWLERQGNYLFGSGDNSLLGDVEKGFENIGRVKVTDLSEESKSELGKYFDWKESADNESIHRLILLVKKIVKILVSMKN